MASYNGKALGTIGDYGCFSFHETKNYSMGEGGALLIRDPEDIERAEIVREKGTNRSKFFRGQIDKYTWMDAGSSYLPSELNAAYLWAQLEKAQEIYDDRMKTWNRYYEALKELEEAFKNGVKLFLYSNPNNPTGAVFSKEEVSEIARLAKKYDVAILADELYNLNVLHFIMSANVINFPNPTIL